MSLSQFLKTVIDGAPQEQVSEKILELYESVYGNESIASLETHDGWLQVVKQIDAQINRLENSILAMARSPEKNPQEMLYKRAMIDCYYGLKKIVPAAKRQLEKTEIQLNQRIYEGITD